MMNSGRCSRRSVPCWDALGNQAPEGSPLRADLQEVREIAQSTLNNIRGLSQALHPVLLEEQGLESTLDWYIPSASHGRWGLRCTMKSRARRFRSRPSPGVQIYRVLQEALNNVSRHSGEREAWVRLKFSGASSGARCGRSRQRILGNGSRSESASQGIGLVGMRERAELIGGTLELLQPHEGGTLVRLTVPREKAEAAHGG